MRRHASVRSPRALGDVEVNGLSRKQTQTFALSAAGGFVGVAVAVSVWSVGTQTNSTYHDADGPLRGTWDSTTANSADKSVFYKEGDVVIFDPTPGPSDPNPNDDNTRYTAKVDHPLNDPTDTTEWDGPTDALHTTSGDKQDTKPSIGGADQAASGSSDSTSTNWSAAARTTPATRSTSMVMSEGGNAVLGTAGDPQTDTADWVGSRRLRERVGGTTSSASAPDWVMGTSDKWATRCRSRTP